MSEQDTVEPTVVDTPTPNEDVNIDTGVEDTGVEEEKQAIVDKAVENPDINVDAGEDEVEEKANDVPEAGNWFDNLDPDYRNDPNVTKYNSLAEFVKGHREMTKMIGKDKLVVPGKNATQEEKDAFYSKLGRPEEAGKYTVPDMDIPESLLTEDGSKEAFKQKAHELGLTDNQFSELYKMNAEMITSRFNQEVAQNEKMAKTSETTLRQEFGAAYESKIDGAQKVINKFFKGQQMHKAFPVLANDTGFIRAMANIAEGLSEDVMVSETRNTKTPPEAQTEWNSIVAGNHNLSKAYFDDTDPEHITAVDYVLGLQKMASAGGA